MLFICGLWFKILYVYAYNVRYIHSSCNLYFFYLINDYLNDISWWPWANFWQLVNIYSVLCIILL